MHVIADYDYITNVNYYDYIAFESNDYDYDYLRSFSRLQSITITLSLINTYVSIVKSFFKLIIH